MGKIVMEKIITRLCNMYYPRGLYNVLWRQKEAETTFT